MLMQFLLSLLILLGTTAVTVFLWRIDSFLGAPMVLGGMVLIPLSFLYMAGYGG